MKKIVTATAVLLIGFSTFVIQAMPQKNNWYIGGKLGISKYFNTGEHDYTYAKNDGITYTRSYTKNLFFGYQLKPYLDCEFGFDLLGNVKYSGENVFGNFKPADLQLSAKLSYPVYNTLNVYTRIGGMIWHARAHQYTKRNNNSMSDEDAGFSPFIAAGVEYAMARDVSLLLDYQFVNSLGDKYIVGSNPKNGSLTLGLSYTFGQRRFSGKIFPKIYPQLVSLISGHKHFDLKTDILFNFDKFTLKSEGKKTLDDLCNTLKTLDQNTTFIILGFTDRIGSIKYNQELSKKRAQTVFNYLVNKGIPSSNMSVIDMGMSCSIAKDHCNKIKNHKALIKCLAPDRRVEIKIKNVNTVSSYFKKLTSKL
ncbi:porin OmpA [Candidatus Pantoea edessiphila]|uniref:Outer membrane protein A n=1 Tax=Candidatus Pantoea edessiphila TaxID=2044610 RepID=A0A2P5SWY7_9GAMM|nr:porin OmpA [Candidatus Pantoea edessiphila]PPI86849.1 porin OmpA [Candidatus Pantoea edessiphila]